MGGSVPTRHGCRRSQLPEEYVGLGRSLSARLMLVPEGAKGHATLCPGEQGQRGCSATGEGSMRHIMYCLWQGTLAALAGGLRRCRGGACTRGGVVGWTRDRILRCLYIKRSPPERSSFQTCPETAVTSAPAGQISQAIDRVPSVSRTRPLQQSFRAWKAVIVAQPNHIAPACEA